MPDEHVHPETPSVGLERLPGDTAIHPTAPLAVVGIGGSAGALDGFERFFLGLPPITGLAFVVVPHLDPGHRGLMPDILRRCTSLQVVEIKDGMVLQADRVYIIPPGFSLSILNGVLQLGDLADVKGNVIDAFFVALAADQREHTVGIVLSGMGTDGTRGIQAIKRWGGQVLVQDPDTAEYISMPSSAAATHLADAVLPPDDLAARLLSLTQQPLSLNAGALLNDSDPASAPLQTILRLVQQRMGHDFSRYKRPTLIRRIERRMLGWRLRDVSQYLRLLEEVPDEIEALFQDFTINVTSFFRDVEVAQVFREQRSEFDAPLAEGLVTDLNAALVKQFLNISVAERETMVQPHSVLDDGHWKTVAVSFLLGHGESAYPSPIKATQPLKDVMHDRFHLTIMLGATVSRRLRPLVHPVVTGNPSNPQAVISKDKLPSQCLGFTVCFKIAPPLNCFFILPKRQAQELRRICEARKTFDRNEAFHREQISLELRREVKVGVPLPFGGPDFKNYGNH